MTKCSICDAIHNLELLDLNETLVYKDEEISFSVQNYYCESCDEYFEDEILIRSNDIRMKDAYRMKVGLLTTNEIKSIRAKYKIGQKDLGLILGWSNATIGRYETYQIQDEIHNDVLCLIRDNPAWLLQKLESKRKIFVHCKKGKAYTKYYNYIAEEVKKCNGQVFANRLEMQYAHSEEEAIFYGNTIFNVKKLIEAINYIAGKVVVHKVKLMKMLWYSDALSFKRTGKSITGIPYYAIEMGAVPKCFEMVSHLEGVKFEVKHYFCDDADSEQYKFIRNNSIGTDVLSENELQTIDKVIEELGAMNTKDIVETMHEEMAFKQTNQNELISFEHAKNLKRLS